MYQISCVRSYADILMSSVTLMKRILFSQKRRTVHKPFSRIRIRSFLKNSSLPHTTDVLVRGIQHPFSKQNVDIV